MSGMVKLMEFAGLFFSWWGFFMGAVLGFGTAFLSALAITPLAYRVKRRRELRRMWRMDRPRPLTAGILPTWADYDPSDETVDLRCVCHNRRLYEGDYVLLWPEVGPMGIMHTSVYCENFKESV